MRLMRGSLIACSSTFTRISNRLALEPQIYRARCNAECACSGALVSAIQSNHRAHVMCGQFAQCGKLRYGVHVLDAFRHRSKAVDNRARISHSTDLSRSRRMVVCIFTTITRGAFVRPTYDTAARFRKSLFRRFCTEFIALRESTFYPQWSSRRPRGGYPQARSRGEDLLVFIRRCAMLGRGAIGHSVPRHAVSHCLRQLGRDLRLDLRRACLADERRAAGRKEL